VSGCMFPERINLPLPVQLNFFEIVLVFSTVSEGRIRAHCFRT